jgi:hypothetical protein
MIHSYYFAEPAEPQQTFQDSTVLAPSLDDSSICLAHYHQTSFPVAYRPQELCQTRPLQQSDSFLLFDSAAVSPALAAPVYFVVLQTDSVLLPDCHQPSLLVLVSSSAAPPVVGVVENPIVSSRHHHLLHLDFVVRHSERRR